MLVYLPTFWGSWKGVNVGQHTSPVECLGIAGTSSMLHHFGYPFLKSQLLFIRIHGTLHIYIYIYIFICISMNFVEFYELPPGSMKNGFHAYVPKTTWRNHRFLSQRIHGTFGLFSYYTNWSQKISNQIVKASSFVYRTPPMESYPWNTQWDWCINLSNRGLVQMKFPFEGV